MDLSVDSPDSLAWQTGRDAAAAAALAALPGRDAWLTRISRLLSDTRQAPLVGRGGRWFQRLVLDPSADQPVLAVRDSPTGEPRVLVDPNELTAERGVPVLLMTMQPSPDGRTVAYVLMEAGKEVNELHLLDVGTGDPLPDTVPWNVGNYTWSADSKGLFVATREVVDGEVVNPIHQLVLGTPPPDEPLPAPASYADAEVVVSADGRHAVVRTGNTEQRLDWIIRDGALQPLLREQPGAFSGDIDGDDLVVIADHDAPRGRLVRIPIATASDPSTWTELVAESDDVLRVVKVVGDVLVVGMLAGASSRLRVLDRDGGLIDELDLPGEGTIGAWPYPASHPALPMFETGDDEISFIRSGFDSPWAVYRYVVSARRLELVTPPAIEVPGLVVRTITATSSDGVEVPAHVVHRADLDTSVPQPTLLYGYGGFNLAYLPGFVAEHTAWAEAGGVFVLAHLRGGSEFGSRWWSEGRRDRKQQTFDDLYAVAEQLIVSGVTTSGRLAVKGESNGGLLAGAAVAQRPDLWAAVVSDVPILDLVGFARDPLTYLIGRVEYGDPHVPEEAEWLRAVSPVHQVRDASYPPVLVTAGANDPRCPVWHARTFVDLLERHQTGEATPLLRVYTDQGHGAGTLSDASGKTADWLAFVADATGLRPATATRP